MDVRDDPRMILLSRLDGVRQTHPDRWISLCPAHEDHNPSLAIRERDDGAILLCCRVGCPVAAVVHAIGLELRDLFPPRPAGHHCGPVPRSERPYLTVPEWGALLRYSVTVVCIAAEDLAAGRAISPEDLEALRDAAADLYRILEVNNT